MDEARSLTYSINVEANTSQAEASIRNITSNLGGLGGSTINIDADTSQAESNIRNVTSSLGGVQTQLGPSVFGLPQFISRTASTAATASRPPYAPA